MIFIPELREEPLAFEENNAFGREEDDLVAGLLGRFERREQPNKEDWSTALTGYARKLYVSAGTFVRATLNERQLETISGIAVVAGICSAVGYMNNGI